MKIAVVGTGYVGLVLGACLAENGNNVVCVDKDESKIAMLKAGKMPIYEPGLEEMVRRNQHEDRLSFTTDLAAAVRPRRSCSSPSARRRAKTAPPICSTCSAVAARRSAGDEQVHRRRRQEHRAGRHREEGARRRSPRETTQPFSVVSNPEFLKQGAAIEDFMKPDRVVIGIEDERRARRGADEGALRAVHAHRRADPDDGHGERRAVQVRGELDPGDADLVHERDRQRLRAGRRRRRSRAQGDRLGPPHRHVVPVSRRRLRRQLLSEGRQGAAASRREDKGYDFKILRAVEDVNDGRRSGSSTRWRRTSANLSGQDDRALGPGVQAAHRRHARGAGDSDHRAAAGARRDGAGPTIRRPRRWRAASSAIASRSATRATTR